MLYKRQHQRGLTIFGLLVWAIFVGFMGLMAIRVWPSFNEYLTIQQTLTRIMKGENRPGSAGEVRAAFDKQSQIEFSIATIKGADLDIQTVNDRMEARFDYNKQIPLVGPVSLLINYSGKVR
ncbi:MAG: DUF4845 domain-containing protein [Ideonella sp. MAG2]|nr:MAG: DUF4845 domain-containing protein [Ideonella sp. MAG2]